MIHQTLKRSVLALGFVALGGGVILSCASLTGGKSSNFKLPKYEEVTLNNGARILYIQDSELPRVSLHALVMTGALHDPKKLPGVNNLVVELLDEGTKDMTAPKLAAAFAQIGADYSSEASYDYSYLKASSISPHRDDLLKLFSSVLLDPAFAAAEVERKKAQLMAGLKGIADDPSALAGRALQGVLYQEHPYGNMPAGNLASLKGIRRADVIRHYFKYFRPNNTILAVVGDFSPEFRTKFETRLASWTQAEIPKLVDFETPNFEKSHLTLVQKNGLQQSQIRLGQIGIPRNSEDYLALRAANVALGGAFASRLTQKVRSELGLTYSIWSYFDARLLPGPFVVTTFSRNDKASEAVTESIKVLDQFIKEGVTKEELKAAKAVMVGQFPASIETGDGLAFNLMLLRRYGVSDSYLSDFIENVNDISVSQARDAVKKHLKPGVWQVVVHADEAATPLPESVGPVSKEGFKDRL